MDNTTVYTLSIPLLFSILFGYLHHFNYLYVSNAKMIIRQGDQIQFLLTRIIELETKIKKLQLNTPNDDFLEMDDNDHVVEDKDDNIIEDDNIVEDDNIGEDDNIVEDDNIGEDDNIPENEPNDKEFEFIEPNSTFKITKNKGWLQYIF
jgi:hypothetical protein